MGPGLQNIMADLPDTVSNNTQDLHFELYSNSNHSKYSQVQSLGQARRAKSKAASSALGGKKKKTPKLSSFENEYKKKLRRDKLHRCVFIALILVCLLEWAWLGILWNEQFQN